MKFNIIIISTVIINIFQVNSFVKAQKFLLKRIFAKKFNDKSAETGQYIICFWSFCASVNIILFEAQKDLA